MEDYLHFVETFSVYIFAPSANGEVLGDSRLRRLWQLLRDATLIVLRPLEHATAVVAAKAAKQLLFEYGKLAEREMGDE